MNTAEQPLVSVLTPVYNGARYLSECIESVLGQTYTNFEYIIVNNCSTDDTLSVASAYGAKDARVRVVTNEKFVGVIDNHNNAFNLMSPAAKYCKIVSGDDYLFPHCIERMVELAEVNPSVGIVGSYQQSGNVVKWQGFRYPRTVFSGREVGRRFFLEDQIFIQTQPVLGIGSPTSLMYRADLVRQTKAFYPNASPHSDTSACFNCLQSCDFGFVYEVLCYERTHEETQTSKSLQMNRYQSATLSDLLQYGPFYLSADELKTQVTRVVKGYHRFLAVNYFTSSQNSEFWNYHRSRLQELGYPLKRFDILKAGVATAMAEIVNPGNAAKKLWKRLAAKPKVAGNPAQPAPNRKHNVAGAE